MKHKYLLVIAFLMIAIVACKKDKKDSPASIFGKWYLQTERLETYDKKGILLKDTTYIAALFPPHYVFYRLFNRDSTGQEPVYVQPTFDTVAYYKYSVKGKSIILNYTGHNTGYKDTLTIVNLSKSLLEVSYTRFGITEGHTVYHSTYTTK